MGSLTDNDDIRHTLFSNYPGLRIEQVIQSGQRVVYFARFDRFTRPDPEALDGKEICSWDTWGDIVLKISDGSNINDMSRMHSEIAALSGIDSDAYPKIFHFELLSYSPEDEGPLEQKLFITIEQRVPGMMLSKCMNKYGSEAEAVGLCIRIIEALGDLWFHTKKYVHRDIKPQNLIIGENGKPFIIDLGIIRQTGQKGITRTMLPIGPCTPGYGSPEQLRNDKENISLKSDLFSIGVIIYEALAGVNPFIENTNGLEEVVHKTLNEQPDSLWSRGCASKELSDIVDGLLEKEPYKRPRSVAKLVAKLKKIQGEM